MIIRALTKGRASAGIVDALEPRRLLAAAPYEIQSIQWKGESVDVAAGRWILQLDHPNTRGKTQNAALRDLLATSAPDFTLDRQLGNDGLFRVDSPVSLAADTAIQQLSSLAGYRFAEPDLIVHADATPNDPSFSQMLAARSGWL